MNKDAAKAPIEDEPTTRPAPVIPASPKMTMGEQAAFLSALCARCIMTGPARAGDLAERADLTIERADMLRLRAIAETLRLMDVHGADVLLRDKIMRRGGGRR